MQISDTITPLFFRRTPPPIPAAPYHYRVHLADKRAIDVFAANENDAKQHVRRRENARIVTVEYRGKL